MQAQTLSSSAVKATTAPEHLQAMTMLGKALIVFKVQKSEAARHQLETLADQAARLGALSPSDASLLADLLTSSVTTTTLN